MTARGPRCGWLAVLLVGLAGVPAPVAAAPPTMTRAEIVDLAEYGVGYSYWWGHGCWKTDGLNPGSCSGSCPSCTHSGSYGADCSGFVAKCWQVPVASPLATDSHPYSTSNFRWDSTHWSQIGWGDAETGDAFVYRNSTDTGGHIVLFDSGDPWGQIWVWEAKGCSYGILHDLKSLSSTYVAIRRDALTEEPQVGTLRGVVFEDLGVGTADMSVRLPGASVECLGEGTTTASSPDGDFSFDLAPGSYTVTGSRSGYLPASRTCQVTAGQETWCSLGLYAECTPDCSGRECGVDPECGEPCGSCGAEETCGPTGQCEPVACPVDCSGRDCGPDPECGAPCGVCPAELVCTDLGLCVPIEPAAAKLYGFVVAVPPGTTGDLSTYPAVPGADLRVDGEPVRESDIFGYYETLVEPGDHVVSASAEGYNDGEVTCSVVARGFTECLVPVYTTDGPGPTPDAGSTDPGTEGYRTGCGCRSGGGPAPVPILAFLAFLLGGAVRRRRR